MLSQAPLLDRSSQIRFDKFQPLLILFSIVFSCLCWGDLSNKYLLVSIAVTFLFGVIGLIDDYLKLRYSNTKGLSGRSRFLWEILVGAALILAIIIYWNRKLAAEISQRKVVESELVQSQKRLHRNG